MNYKIAKMQQLFIKKQANEIFDIDSTNYQQRVEAFETFKFLDRLDEDFLFNNYQVQLASDSPLPMVGFSPEHKEMFLRLKFRSINSRIPKLTLPATA